MGNAAGKLNSSTVCDGGGLVPNGIYKEDAQDFDAKAVQRLIFARHMAPFYLGADDPEEDSKAGPTAQPPGSNNNNNNDDGWWSYNLMLAQRESSEPLGNTGSALNGGQLSSASSTDDGLLHQSQGDRTAASGHTRKGSGLLRRLKGSSPPNQQTSDAQQPARSQSTPLAQHERSLSDAAARAPEDVWRQLLRRHIECPICFLYYPKNINYTRCCHKPICTECFVQIKRKIEDDRIESTHCPYCVEPNLGIVYYSPAINNTGRAYAKHRKQLSSQLSQSSIASSTKGTQPTISADSSSSPASSQQHIRSATTVSQTPPAVLAEAGRARSQSSASTIGGGGGPGRLVEPTIVMSDDIRPSLAKELAGQLDSKRKQQLRSAENMAMIAAATRRMSSRQQQRLSQARMSGDTSAIDDMPLAYIQSSAMRARLLDRG
ncbi:SNF1-interacting protein, partial [Coemansia sp. IMI 209127]